MTKGNFEPFAARMEQEGLPDIAIRTFHHYYNQLVAGNTGLISERDIRPVDNLPDAEHLGPDLAEVGQQELGAAVIIKLNGGLGTSMGLLRAKSLLTVKDGLTFLDIIARQAQALDVPLILMNSFNTREDSLAALGRYPGLGRRIPLDFQQHKIPKINQEALSPANYPEDPDLEWCPPGHGDIYTALITSGMLDELLKHGYRYAFVSNADNLGAYLDPALLGYFVTAKLPFMMEAANRTLADRKGGHLARRPDGGLLLRESAQCPPEDQANFQDISRHRYFNTNNLWLHLPSLATLLEEKEGILGLPMIRNSKTVNPRDPESSAVYQLETAMGSAIGVFQGAGAIRVPRTRFSPVKTTADLLGVRSDSYVLTPDFRVVPDPIKGWTPVIVELDSRFYRLIEDLEARFPHGAPSMRGCERFSVEGDVTFGRDITLWGCVAIRQTNGQPRRIADGMTLRGPC